MSNLFKETAMEIQRQKTLQGTEIYDRLYIQRLQQRLDLIDLKL